MTVLVLLLTLSPAAGLAWLWLRRRPANMNPHDSGTADQRRHANRFHSRFADMTPPPLLFHPRYCAVSGQIIGLDVLPESPGLLHPHESRQTIAQTCRSFRRWQHTGVRPLRLGVRLDGHALVDPAFPAFLKELLHGYDMTAHALEFRFETAPLRRLNHNRLLAGCHQLKNMGLNLSLDAHGVADECWSAGLSADPLFQLPWDYLRVATEGMLASDSDQTPKQFLNLAGLAKSDQIVPVATGISDPDIFSFSIHSGYQELQGSFLCEPMGMDGMLSVVRCEELFKQQIRRSLAAPNCQGLH